MPAPAQAPRQFAFIDCVRGYAVLLVIVSHLAGHYPNLPGVLQQLAGMGYCGVQLFFLASAMTLLMSWHHAGGGQDGRRAARPRVLAFLLRRFFRIAPAYYAAAGLYALLWPPGARFDLTQLLVTLGFANGWSPNLMPTVPGGWLIVEGGWSIAVEVTFYLVFPLLAAVVTSLRRAAVLFALCLVVGAVANRIAAPLLAGSYGAVAVKNFLYYWFPNQMAVFALGAALYFVWRALSEGRHGRLAAWLARHGTLAPGLCLAAFLGCAFLRLPHLLGDGAPFLPLMIAASLCLAAFVLTMSQARGGWFVNPLAATLGKASFSMYLLHFAVIRLLVTDHPSTFHVDAPRLWSVPACAVGWLVVVAATAAAAWGSYRMLELPMMALGKRLSVFALGHHAAPAALGMALHQRPMARTRYWQQGFFNHIDGNIPASSPSTILVMSSDARRRIAAMA